MKQITFTSEERNLLQSLLNKRLRSLKTHLDGYSLEENQGRKKFENFYLNPVKSSLEKITVQETTFYDIKEKTALISCINEHYDGFYEELKLSTPISWLTISEQQSKIISKIDNCKGILSKCGYNDIVSSYTGYNTKFRFRDRITMIEKLKNSDKIFLSGNEKNGFYKIAFVPNNQEYFSFELNQEVSFRNINTILLNGKSPEEVAKKYFSLIVTKPKAKELLSKCDNKDYPEGVLNFVNKLLSYL